MRLRDFTKELDCKYIINSTIGFQPRVVDSTREAAYGCRFDLGTNFWTKGRLTTFMYMALCL